MTVSLLIALGLLLGAAGLTYLASEYFVNGVEWLGRKSGIAQGAVASILAAFGTALPESVVTFMAVVFAHDEAGKGIGIGAALGGPLVLATIAYGVAGWSLIAARPTAVNTPLELNVHRLARDQRWFLVIFLIKVALGYVVFSFKPWLALAFVAAYGIYLWVELTEEDEDDEEVLEPLKFQPRRADPSFAMVVLQTGLALAVVFIASDIFVRQIGVVAPYLGLSPTLVALLLSPVATELPETMNAIIWIRQGKLNLALANISGSMMIQATIPSALGIYFTPWLFDNTLGLAAAVTILSIAGLWLLVRNRALTPVRLAAFGGFYLVFVAGTILLAH